MPETQITLTRGKHKAFQALKKKIEADVMLSLTNPQILEFLMSYYLLAKGDE